MNKKSRFVLALIVFGVGFTIGLIFNTQAVWTDLEGMSFWGYPEATSFDQSIEIDGELSPLQCPVLITSHEVATVKIRVTNKTDNQITPWLQASISKPGERDSLVRHKQELILAPRETKTMSWQVSNENTLLNRSIFVRTFLFKIENYPPSLTRHCGIMVRDFGSLTGTQIILLVVISSLVLMGVGWWLWWSNLVPLRRRENRVVMILGFMFALNTISFVSNLTGNLVISGFALVLTALSLIAIVETFAYHRN
ncbi:MAG TPA: hypothetical protein PLT26_11040 [Anaerolineaceae bacterium]|nr:hypothetical protein [Anaerolineaceae bacterium]HQH86012.1 hypothetical protein [Anaerolineaceae bacterium]